MYFNKYRPKLIRVKFHVSLSGPDIRIGPWQSLLVIPITMMIVQVEIHMSLKATKSDQQFRYM